MAFEEEEVVDFRLVSTYVPLVMLMLRSVLLLGAAQFAAAALDAHGTLVVTLVAVVYFDALAFRHDRLNQACGFLCPVALCVMQARPRDRECDAGYAQALVYAVDMVWAVSCTSYVAIACYKGLFVVRVVYAGVLWALCAVVHSLATCERLDVQHQIVRTVLYYLTCTLFFYHRHLPALLDRNSHQLSVMHIFYHVFFVQHYVLLGSVLVATLVFGAAYYAEHLRAPVWAAAKAWGGDATAKRAAQRQPPRVVPSTAGAAGALDTPNEAEDLMRELRAAQKMNEQA